MRVKKQKHIPVNISNDHDKLIEEYTFLYQQFKKRTYYEVLAVDFSASEKQIKHAYNVFAKQFHPEKFTHTGNEKLIKIVTAISTLFLKACEGLIRMRTNAIYTRKDKDGKIDTSNILNSETLESEAQKFAEQDKFQDAIISIVQAINLQPSKLDLQIDLAWYRYNTDPEKEKPNSLELIQRMINYHKRMAKAFYYKGKILKLSGDLDRSLRSFERYLKLNPKDIEAQREIKLLSQRIVELNRPWYEKFWNKSIDFFANLRQD